MWIDLHRTHTRSFMHACIQVNSSTSSLTKSIWSNCGVGLKRRPNTSEVQAYQNRKTKSCVWTCSDNVSRVNHVHAHAPCPCRSCLGCIYETIPHLVTCLLCSISACVKSVSGWSLIRGDPFTLFVQSEYTPRARIPHVYRFPRKGCCTDRIVDP